jgi:hypothetical protein
MARFAGTMTRPVRGPGGEYTAPADQPSEADFCTPARWGDGRSAEENLGSDRAGLMTQIGVAG